MTKKKPALTPLDKKIRILEALYPYRDGRDGLNKSAIENGYFQNKVDLNDELNELLALNYIVELSGDHVRKNSTFFNITGDGREMVDLIKTVDANPKGKKLLEWGRRIKSASELQYQHNNEFTQNSKP